MTASLRVPTLPSTPLFSGTSGTASGAGLTGMPSCTTGAAGFSAGGATGFGATGVGAGAGDAGTGAGARARERGRRARVRAPGPPASAPPASAPALPGESSARASAGTSRSWPRRSDPCRECRGRGRRSRGSTRDAVVADRPRSAAAAATTPTSRIDRVWWTHGLPGRQPATPAPPPKSEQCHMSRQQAGPHASPQRMETLVISGDIRPREAQTARQALSRLTPRRSALHVVRMDAADVPVGARLRSFFEYVPETLVFEWNLRGPFVTVTSCGSNPDPGPLDGVAALNRDLALLEEEVADLDPLGGRACASGSDATAGSAAARAPAGRGRGRAACASEGPPGSLTSPGTYGCPGGKVRPGSGQSRQRHAKRAAAGLATAQDHASPGVARPQAGCDLDAAGSGGERQPAQGARREPGDDGRRPEAAATGRPFTERLTGPRRP